MCVFEHISKHSNCVYDDQIATEDRSERGRVRAARRAARAVCAGEQWPYAQAGARRGETRGCAARQRSARQVARSQSNG